eukprot:4477086-Amphidinium_carterae.1
MFERLNPLVLSASWALRVWFMPMGFALGGTSVLIKCVAQGLLSIHARSDENTAFLDCAMSGLS